MALSIEEIRKEMQIHIAAHPKIWQTKTLKYGETLITFNDIVDKTYGSRVK